MKRKIIIAVGWLAIWQLVSLALHNSVLLVGPVAVLQSLIQNIVLAEFWTSLSASFLRITGGFLTGTIVGIGAAYASHRNKWVREILAPLVAAMKAVPVASFVILLLIWFGSNLLSFWISLLVVFPIIYLNCLKGLDHVDIKMQEMAEVFQIPTISKLRFIELPQMMPFLHSAISLAIGMSWKSGIAAEVIGQPLLSAGNQLYRSKIYLDTAGLLSWTVVIVLVSWIMEKIFMFLLEILENKITGAKNGKESELSRGGAR